jgi:hypothetical protein
MYRTETKVKKEMENKYKKPNQQTEFMKANE